MKEFVNQLKRFWKHSSPIDVAMFYGVKSSSEEFTIREERDSKLIFRLGIVGLLGIPYTEFILLFKGNEQYTFCHLIPVEFFLKKMLSLIGPAILNRLRESLICGKRELRRTSRRRILQISEKL